MEKAIRVATVSISQDEEPEDDGTCLGGFRSHMQRSFKGELQSLKNLTLSAQQVTKLVICVVWSLRGQLCALIALGAITGSSGTSLKGRHRASFQ